MEETNSNLLHYGFSSLDEEIAKDQMDAENAFDGASADLSNSVSDGVLQNINPAAILDITGPTRPELLDRPAPATAASQTSAQVASQQVSAKRKAPARSRKRKAGKTPRDENAPKLPQTGYVMYMNERRDTIKAVTPNITFSELTKTIAAEWSGMEQQQKKTYLESAEEKKGKYLTELTAYQQTETYKDFVSKKQTVGVGGGPKAKAPEKDSPSTAQPKEASARMPGMDIPIFTEEFLEHNKSREKELRELRKLNYQYEEQNAILSTQVDELKKLVNTLEEEANIQRNNNMALIQHLESLRDTLATNFVGVPLPDTNEVPTVATIDSYMAKLHQIILGAPQENEDLIVAVREVVNKLNLEAYVT